MQGTSDSELLTKLIRRTLVLLETEYPNGLRLVLHAAPSDPVTPRGIYPAFYGCYDWHSSVHSHWQVVRALRAAPSAPFHGAATAVLDRTLTTDNIAVEMAWLDERPNFEMPYGMAWLLRLCGELRDWHDERAQRWAAVLQPLEAHALQQFEIYLDRHIVPVRGGMHAQTAFSLGLVADAVDPVANPRIAVSITDAAVRFFGDDTDVDVRYEPSAADFLSPALCEADLMRRVLPSDRFTDWLVRFTPDGFAGLDPVTVVDPSNGQLAHWAGLNLSRSWMLTAIAKALHDSHPIVARLRASAADHRVAGLATADHDDYMISHWVPTFAVYLLTTSTPTGR